MDTTRAMYALMLLSALLMASGVCFVALGLVGVLRKRPICISTKWTGLVLLPAFLFPVLIFIGIGKGLLIIGPLVPFVLVGMARAKTVGSSGYIVLGASDASLRDAMTYAFAKQGIPLAGEPPFVQLGSGEVDVALQPWLGMARLRSKEKDGASRLRGVVVELKQYFRERPVELDMNGFVLCIVLGVGSTIGGAALAWIMPGL